MTDRNTNTLFILYSPQNGKMLCARSPVPAVLQEAGVPKQLWEQTYDGLQRHEAALAAAKKDGDVATVVSVSFWLSFWVAFAIMLVTMLAVMDQVAVAVFGWLSICFLIATLVSCIKSRRLSSKRLTKLSELLRFQRQTKERFEGVGIVVEVDNLNGCIIFRSSPLPNDPIPSRSAGRTMTEDLESLQRLRENGALTEAEFEHSKNQIWKDHGVAIVARAEILLEEPVADRICDENGLELGTIRMP